VNRRRQGASAERPTDLSPRSPIGAALRGAPVNLYTALAADPDEAARFSHSQHVGSLGPARLLARKIKLESPGTVLDVAGGSGAFTIALCGKHPNLRATILDFPAVIEIARHYVAEASLQDRVGYIEEDALKAAWPTEQDVVLFSYLLSAVGKADIESLVRRAYASLEPGGMLIVHDFMVDDDLTGPASAALWMLVIITSAGARVPQRRVRVGPDEGCGFRGRRRRSRAHDHQGRGEGEAGWRRLIPARRPQIRQSTFSRVRLGAEPRRRVPHRNVPCASAATVGRERRCVAKLDR